VCERVSGGVGVRKFVIGSFTPHHIHTETDGTLNHDVERGTLSLTRWYPCPCPWEWE